jgi:23S rRNA (pseudouridine1915-N3)-methyltransferase
MRVRILAVGTRMPGWVTTAYEDYTRRMRKDMRVDLEEIPVGRVKADEEKRLLERIGDDYLVALDERGKSLTTLQLAKWLGERQQDGRNLTFVIGGPDGLGPNVLLKAALVAVGPDLSPCHGARDPRRTTVSRALGVAESPLPSRMRRPGGRWGRHKNKSRCCDWHPRRRAAGSCWSSSACRTW